jgi:DNA-binding IclR family transcriptional regulator
MPGVRRPRQLRGKVLLSTYDEDRIKRFLRKALPALIPHTITTRRALSRGARAGPHPGGRRPPSTSSRRASGVCVGIFGESRTLIGAINVSDLTQRLDEAARRRAAGRMREVVDEAALQHGRRAAA